MTGRTALRALAVAGAGYLIGSVSFTRVVGRVARPDLVLDATPLSWRDGVGISSDDVSGTTLEVNDGPRLGVLASTLDIAKAVIPVALLHRAAPEERYDLVCAVAVMLGHNRPVYYGFQGGRGTSVLLGSLLVVDPVAIPISIALGQVVGIYVVRDVLFAQHAGWLLVLPLWFALRRDRPLVLFALAANVVRWAVSIDELRQWWPLYRSGELRTREFHDAVEQTHLGYVHAWLRRRGLVTYDYMRPPA
ncbi:MAG: glycerol-3-phosphate acyltransferase [Jiangellales bacterium]